MPNKAKLTTRERSSSNVSSDNLNKGSELSFAEVDSNFINLRDQSIAISDGSTTTDIDAGETITFSGASVSGNTVTVPTGAGMTVVGDDSSGTLINGGETLKIAGGSNVTTAMSGDTLTITAGGSGDITSVVAGDGLTGGATTGDATLNIGAGTGIDVATDAISVDVSDFMANGSDNRVVTATGTDAMNAEANLTFDGSTLAVTGNITATTSIANDAIQIDDNQIATTRSNDDLMLATTGTGEINLNAKTRFNKNYTEDIQALTSATTIAVDCSLSPVFNVTLAHSATFNFSNLAEGQSVSLIITQDGTGSRTGAFTSVLFPGNEHTLSTGANDIDIISIFNDGTSLLGNISKDYS